MPLARIGTKLVYFSHIPKTGGSSVEAYLRTKGSVGLVAKGVPWGPASPQHIPVAVADAWMPDGFVDAKFTILRDPVERLMSAFRMRATEGTVHWANPLDWIMTAWGKITGRRLYRMSGTRWPILIDVSSWVRLVFALRNVRPAIHDNHITPQSDFVSEDMTVFKFEDGLEPVFNWIDGISQSRRSKGRFHNRAGRDLVIDVSPALRARIRRYYAADYDLIEHYQKRALATPSDQTTTIAQ